jgi:hypothetical protein
MATALLGTDLDRGDLIQAVAFAQTCFDRWHQDRILGKEQYHNITTKYSALRDSLQVGEPILTDTRLPSPDVCWSCKRTLAPKANECGECGAPAHTLAVHQLRYFIFTCFEIKKFRNDRSLTLSAADACLADANAHIAALRRKLDGERKSASFCNC